MKYFYLRFTQDDFNKDGQSWVTDTINLRNNTQYKNYSTHKSKYGLNLIGDSTWTGMNNYGVDQAGNTVTSSGFVENDRFVDTTARVDVTKHTLNVKNYTGANLDYDVKFYATNHPDDEFPRLWNMKAVARGRNIYRIDTDDYARFEIIWPENFDTTNIEVEYVVEVQIAESQVDALFERTRSVLDVFPEWMALRDDSLEPATPSLATPNSTGGAFINAVAGDTLEDLRTSMLYLKTQMFLTTAAENQKAWIYITEDTPEFIYTVEGDGVELARSFDAREFYESDEDDDVAYFMDIGNVLWTNKKYNQLLINGEEVESHPVHVWNWFDEHGLLFDLKRLHLEGNDSFRKRILDVFINMPVVSLEGVKRSLRRELNLWKTYLDATPDSHAIGATPTIVEMEDINQMVDYFDPDGMPTQKMRDLVLWLSETYPSTWGFFKWGNALWDVGGVDNAGYSVLPYRFDAESGVPLDAGVGDLDDLYVFRPDEIELTTTFNYSLELKGLRREVKQEHREAIMTLLISGMSDIEYYMDRAQADITVWVTDIDENTYWANTTLDSGEIRSLTPITDRAEAYLDLIDDNNYLTKSLDWGIDGSDEIVFSQNNANEDIEIPIENIVDIAVSWGWDYDLSSITPAQPPDNGYGYLVFNEDATPTTLPANSDGTRLHADNFYSDVRLVAEWDNSGIITEFDKITNEQSVTIKMNGAPPNNSVKNAIYDAPIINFPDSAVDETKVWRVEIYSINDQSEGVATTFDAEENPIEIPNTNIALNGDASWAGNVKEIPYDENNRSLEFSTIDSATYPTDYDVWHPFTAYGNDSFQGVVDENGAWLEGIRPDVGQTNTRVKYFRLDRDDFYIADSSDPTLINTTSFRSSEASEFMVTWMGVNYDQQDSIVAYLDTNTVKPAEHNSELVYPDNAIVERWDIDDLVYSFSEFYVHARKIQRANPKWNPFINSGWMFDKEDEYYLYADKKLESFTTNVFQLEKQPNLGAPIIIKTNEATPIEYRQVAFIEDYATPTLTSTYVETVLGNGTNNLYLSYKDVFDVSVVNSYTGQDVTVQVDSLTNIVEVSETTSFDVEYLASYKINKSFLAEHGVVSDDGNLTTEITIIDATPFNDYTVVYEGSEYNFATPVDVPLNPAYTLRDEGFIFICFDEFEYSFVQIKLSPGTIASTTEDFALLSLLSIDKHGNSKPQQTFDVSTDWGTLTNTTITTDQDGYAFSTLIGEDDLTRTSGEITISKDAVVVGRIGFKIGQIVMPDYKLIALPSANSLPADGDSRNFIFGRVIAPDDLPVPHAVINYRRGESVQDVFAQDYLGQTVTDASGRFTIGPIVSATPNDPRTVFYAVESWSVDDASPATPGEVATPNFDLVEEFGPVGDMVYWREFPAVTKGLNEYNYLPTDTINYNEQAANFLSSSNSFPIAHDEATPNADATPNLQLDWQVPGWYAINAYKQYQLGLRGDDFYEADYYYQGSHPDYKEF